MLINHIFSVIYYIGLFLDLVGVSVVIVASLIALYRLLFTKVKKIVLREELVHNVILRLEFIIAADVLLVTTAESIDDVILLGTVVVVRVLLGYSLRGDFRNIKQSKLITFNKK